MSDKLRSDNLTVPQGTDFKIQWPIRDGNLQPIPAIETWSARAQARADIDSPDVLAAWSTDDATIELVDSTLTLIITAAKSSSWTWQAAMYDIELISPAGAITRLTQGQMTVDPEVTRD